LIRITPFSVFRYLIRYRSLNLCKIAPNYRRFLPSQIPEWASPQNVYPNCHACLAARHVEKLREVIPPGLKVITDNTLNFKPICECLFKKKCWGPLSLLWCAIASLGHSELRAGSTPYGPKCVLSKKLIWVGQSPHVERCC